MIQINSIFSRNLEIMQADQVIGVVLWPFGLKDRLLPDKR